MGNDLSCTKCGHKEAVHCFPNDVEEPDVRIKGYKHTLKSCPGYRDGIVRRKPTRRQIEVENARARLMQQRAND